jgi:sugar phosphate isomerase/epimerase
MTKLTTALNATTSLAMKAGMPWFFADSFVSTLSMLKDLGYAGIDLVLRHPSDAYDAEVPEILDASGLTLCSVITGLARKIDGLSLADPRTAGMAVDRIRSHIEFASAFGAKVIVGWMLGHLPEGDDREIAEKALISSLRACAEIATAYGVEILLEPLNRYESNVIRTFAEAAELIARVGGGLWVLLDTFHMNIEEADPLRTAHDAGSLVRHVHLADSNRQVPGTGHFPFHQFLANLHAGGFDGTFSIEALPIPDVFSAARSAISTWRAITTAILGEPPVDDLFFDIPKRHR